MQEFTSCHWLLHGLSFENDHIEMCCLCCHKGGGRLYIKENYNGKDLTWDDIISLKQKLTYSKFHVEGSDISETKLYNNMFKIIDY